VSQFGEITVIVSILAWQYGVFDDDVFITLFGGWGLLLLFFTV